MANDTEAPDQAPGRSPRPPPRPSPRRGRAPRAPKAPRRQRCPPATPRAASTGHPGVPREGGPRCPQAKVASRQQRANPARERRERYQRGVALRYAAIGLGVLAAVAAVLLVAFSHPEELLDLRDHLRRGPAHRARHRGGPPEPHQGARGLHAAQRRHRLHRGGLRKNPWIASVCFERASSRTLKIHDPRAAVDALVVMSSGLDSVVPRRRGEVDPAHERDQAAEDQSVNDAALAMAQGACSITDVPATVAPEAGSAATDASCSAVQKFREGFSEDFASQVVSYSAASTDDISCMLENGSRSFSARPPTSPSRSSGSSTISSRPRTPPSSSTSASPTEKGRAHRRVDNVPDRRRVRTGGGRRPFRPPRRQEAQADQELQQRAEESAPGTLDQDQATDQTHRLGAPTAPEGGGAPPRTVTGGSSRERASS